MAGKKEAVKGFFRKLWHILWKDDSFTGWLLSLIFIILFILLIFLPLLRTVTGTSLPLAIVESCSMYHEGNLFSDFDSWFEDHEEKYSQYFINELDFKGFPFKNGFNKGDILFIVRANPEKLEEGDIIIFSANQRNPVIHRIVDIRESNGERIFSTIGDNNWQQFPFEEEIGEDQLMGKAVIKLAPYVGWIKLWIYEWQKPQTERGSCRAN